MGVVSGTSKEDTFLERKGWFLFVAMIYTNNFGRMSQKYI